MELTEDREDGFPDVFALQEPLSVDFADVNEAIPVFERRRKTEAIANADFAGAEPEHDLDGRAPIVAQDEGEIEQVALREIVLPVALQLGVNQQSLVGIKEQVGVQIGHGDQFGGQGPGDDDFLAED